MIPLEPSHVLHLSQNYPSPQPTMATDFPPPRSTAELIGRDALARQFTVLGDLLNAGTLLIDVRRTDYEGGTIRGSLNLPAQSFPYNMATLWRLCAGDGLAVISRVVFYCGRFSRWPGGRRGGMVC